MHLASHDPTHTLSGIDTIVIQVEGFVANRVPFKCAYTDTSILEVKMRAISMTALFSIVVACTAGGRSEGEAGGQAAGGQVAGGQAASGEMLVAANACGGCHTGSSGTLAGGDVTRNNVYPPNLTPDVDTGLGGWTADDITTAIAKGEDNQGMMLCSSMPRFGALSAQELADLVAYLRSLPAVEHQVPNRACTDK